MLFLLNKHIYVESTVRYSCNFNSSNHVEILSTTAVNTKLDRVHYYITFCFNSTENIYCDDTHPSVLLKYRLCLHKNIKCYFEVLIIVHALLF